MDVIEPGRSRRLTVASVLLMRAFGLPLRRWPSNGERLGVA